MQVVPITEKNAHIFDVFEQDYEAEFSSITEKRPDENGRFFIEADWRAPNKGFYLYFEEKPAGFCVVTQVENRFDIGEFFILPCYRKKGLGKDFAFHIFNQFPGQWQVRQLIGAKEVTCFWRKVIRVFTQDHYKEETIEDAHWGQVVCQYFEVS